MIPDLLLDIAAPSPLVMKTAPWQQAPINPKMQFLR
jgi:hypothetical protein